MPTEPTPLSHLRYPSYAARTIGTGTLRVDRLGPTPDGRVRYEWTITIDGHLTDHGDDLTVPTSSDAGAAHELATLCVMLEAAAESYLYRLSTGRRHNRDDLFADDTIAWAHHHLEELGLIRTHLEAHPLAS